MSGERKPENKAIKRCVMHHRTTSPELSEDYFLKLTIFNENFSVNTNNPSMNYFSNYSRDVKLKIVLKNQPKRSFHLENAEEIIPS